MKATLWTVIILVVLIAAIGITSATLGAKVSRDFTLDLEAAKDSIRAGDWQKARSAVEDMTNEWEETCQWLQFWVNHTDTDDVNLGLERLAAALEAEDKGLSLWAAAELNESLRHIHHRDALRIGNIL